MEKDFLKTGTTTVGIVCKDGIVLAADKRASLGGRIVSDKKSKKIVTITNNVAVTTAGLVSDIQLIIKIIKAQIKINELKSGKKQSVKEIANLLSGLVYGNIRRFSTIPGIVGFLMGGKDSTGHYLYELEASGSITQYTDYVADGSGMMFALGVLEANYNSNQSINDGIKLAVQAINAAIQRDTASGNGIDVIAITKDGVQQLLEKEIDTRISA